MARRVSLLSHSSRSQNQAKELLCLYLTSASEFPHTPHLPSQIKIPLHFSEPVSSLPQVRIRRTFNRHALLFILNKSYHQVKSLPELQLKEFIPYSLRSPLEVSNSPLNRISKHDEFEMNERTVELNTKLSELLLQLKNELPLFFEKSHPFSIYSSDLKFDFHYSPLSFKLSSRLQYKILFSSIRSIFKLFYSELRFDILKITKCQPSYSIFTRWRLTGVYRLSRSNRSVFDAISTFYMDEKGLVKRHTLERVSKNTRKLPTLAWFFIAVGYYPELKENSTTAVEFVSKGKKINRKHFKQNSHT